MNTEFIHKNSRNLRLIIIFSGWSCDRNMFREIHRTGWDILVCWGYDDFNFDKTILKEYKTIYLYAWSLGVFAAEKSLAGVEITKAFAINGTPLPVSDSFGIPQKIYSSTTETLSERNLYKFRIRMCGGIKKFEEKKNLFPTAYSIPVLRSN